MLTLFATLAGGALIAAGGQSPAAVDTAAPVAAQWRRDSVYLTAARTRVDGATDGELLDTARAVCDEAAAGWALDEVVANVRERLHLGVLDGAFVTAAAVRAQCPEHAALIGAE